MAFDDETRTRLETHDLVTADLAQGVPAALPPAHLIVHAAALTTDHADLGCSRAAHIAANTRPLLAMMEHAARTPPDAFVFLSSSGVFAVGDGQGALTDTDQPTGQSPYAAAKRAGELLVLAGFDGTPAVHVVRLGYVYGPHEAARPSRARVSLVAQWLAAARAGRAIAVRADDPARDWTYAPDLAPALARLAAGASAGRPVHLGSPHVLSDSALAALVTRHFPEATRTTEQVTGPMKPPMAPSDIPQPARLRLDRSADRAGAAGHYGGRRMTEVRIILVGLGARARIWRRVLVAHPACRIVGLVDTRPEAVAAALAETPGAIGGVTLADVASRRAADAVILSTPPGGRDDQIAAACAAGLAILAEKPLADSVAAAEAHVVAAATAGVPLAVGLNFRYLAVTQALKALVDAGSVGPAGVRSLHLRALARWPAAASQQVPADDGSADAVGAIDPPLRPDALRLRRRTGGDRGAHLQSLVVDVPGRCQRVGAHHLHGRHPGDVSGHLGRQLAAHALRLAHRVPTRRRGAGRHVRRPGLRASRRRRRSPR